jgi:hypothetical protein
VNLVAILDGPGLVPTINWNENFSHLFFPSFQVFFNSSELKAAFINPSYQFLMSGFNKIVTNPVAVQKIIPKNLSGQQNYIDYKLP